MHSPVHFHELPVYLPRGWRVVPRWDRLILVAPDRGAAQDFCIGAAGHIRATSERLSVPVEIHWCGKTERLETPG